MIAGIFDEVSASVLFQCAPGSMRAASLLASGWYLKYKARGGHAWWHRLL